MSVHVSVYENDCVCESLRECVHVSMFECE